jgi:hypothetical protein
MAELNEKAPVYSTAISVTKTRKPEKVEAQDNALQQKLSSIDINALSPLEALNLLSKLKDEAIRKKTPISKKPQERQSDESQVHEKSATYEPELFD